MYKQCTDEAVPCVCTATSSGSMERSTTLRFDVPYTLSLGSTTPPDCLGSIDAVPHVSSRNVIEIHVSIVSVKLTPDCCDVLANVLLRDYQTL